MNTTITSREAILAKSREIIMEQGIPALNMRAVANACSVAVGSIYNYFPSKADLINAAVEDVWRDIFHMSDSAFAFSSFTDCLSWLFDSIRKGCVKYPGFFTLHSVGFAEEEKETGQRTMEHYWGHMKEGLLKVLEQDPLVRKDAFGEDFSRDVFVEMVFSLLLSLLLSGCTDSSPLLTMAGRCIY